MKEKDIRRKDSCKTERKIKKEKTVVKKKDICNKKEKTTY